jgi:hypothetical protein
LKLVGEDLTQCVELVGSGWFIGIHGLNARVHRTGAKARIDFDSVYGTTEVVP